MFVVCRTEDPRIGNRTYLCCCDLAPQDQRSQQYTHTLFINSQSELFMYCLGIVYKQLISNPHISLLLSYLPTSLLPTYLVAIYLLGVIIL